MTDRNHPQDVKRDHISVCICTYKRPEMLCFLLKSLQDQATDDLFIYSIVVVDNDSKQSAKAAVSAVKNESSLDIQYFVEPEQNIALARNKAVENANGNLIAFLDDDEFPVSHWLLNLYTAYIHYGVDGVLGPVLPHFDGNPPAWLILGKFCERKSYDTGKVLHWDATRTGNVLFNKMIFDDTNCRFDPKYGRSGGEDIDFFKKSIQSGRTFIWCNEAPVYETVPPDRWKESFYLKKSIRIGGVRGNTTRLESGRIKHFMKVAIASIIYLFLLPISIVIGRHIFLKYTFKLTYNIGWIFGFVGIPIVSDK